MALRTFSKITADSWVFLKLCRTAHMGLQTVNPTILIAKNTTIILVASYAIASLNLLLNAHEKLIQAFPLRESGDLLTRIIVVKTTSLMLGFTGSLQHERTASSALFWDASWGHALQPRQQPGRTVLDRCGQLHDARSNVCPERTPVSGCTGN